MAELKQLLRDMVLIPALSGYETRMANYLGAALEPWVDESKVDTLGNLITTIRGRDSRAPRVMVFAHMDQLGFVVRRIEPCGLLRFERLGGIPEKVLPGTRVLVESEDGSPTPGVIGIKAHHVTTAEEKRTVTAYPELYIDIGAESGERVRELGIEVGCPVVYEPRLTELRGNRIAATSIDDRGGCAVLVKLAEHARNESWDATVHLVGSVQEEFNLRGAMVAAQALKPDIAVSVDLMVASDTPDLRDRSDLALGAGPVIGMYSFHGRGTLNGTLPHPSLVRHFRRVARERSIPLQRSAHLGSLTDSSYVQLVDAGIPSIDLGFPVRYTHTPIETCDLADLEGLVSLLAAGIAGISGGFDFSRSAR